MMKLANLIIFRKYFPLGCRESFGKTFRPSARKAFAVHSACVADDTRSAPVCMPSSEQAGSHTLFLNCPRPVALQRN